MKKALLILLLASLTAVLSACGLLGNAEGASPELEIQTVTTAVGAVDETGDAQVLSYTLTIANNGTVPVYVQGVEPLLGPEFNSLVLAETLFVPVDKTLEQSDVALIEGEILFDAQGLSKAAIDELAPYMDGMNVTTVHLLELPPGGGQIE